MGDMLAPAAWGDGLPAIAPTRPRVEAMLGAFESRREEVVAVLPPAMARATYEKVAANAVLAGCAPGRFPLVVAAVRALGRPAFQLDGVVTTVHGQWPMVVVSGPPCGVWGGADALGSSVAANATLGRAVSLCVRNLAAAGRPGMDAATLGHPGKLSFCFAENRDDSPWPAWTAEAGLAGHDETAVTVYASDSLLVVADMGSDDPEAIVATIAESAAVPGTYNAFFAQDLWLLVSPEHARAFSAAGWSRHDLACRLWELARIEAGRLRRRGLFGFVDDALRPPWLDGAEAGDRIPIVRDPSLVRIAVVGGPAGGYTAIVFGAGTSVTEVVAWR